MKHLALLLLLCMAVGVQAAPLVAKYVINTPNSSEMYFLQLIEAALARTKISHGGYTVVFREEGLSASRKLHLLVEGELINIAWLPLDAKPGPRLKLLQVPVPIMRGLLGYRIPLVHAEKPDLMRDVSNLQDLAKLRLGQGKNWAEVDIYRHNGLQVIEALNMHSLLRMLSGERFDYVPLGVTEVATSYNLDQRDQPELIADSHLLLYYPFPVYFYVSQTAPELAERLTLGLHAMVADGEFFTLFNAHFEEQLAALNLTKRRLIPLRHPYFDHALDAINQQLLYNPLAQP
jgi:hypothetical protein